MITHTIREGDIVLFLFLTTLAVTVQGTVLATQGVLDRGHCSDDACKWLRGAHFGRHRKCTKQWTKGGLWWYSALSPPGTCRSNPKSKCYRYKSGETNPKCTWCNGTGIASGATGISRPIEDWQGKDNIKCNLDDMTIIGVWGTVEKMFRVLVKILHQELYILARDPEGNHYTWIYTFGGKWFGGGDGSIAVTLLPGEQYTRFEDFIDHQTGTPKGYRCIEYRDIKYKWRKPTNPMSIETFHEILLSNPKTKTYRPIWCMLFKSAESLNCIRFMELGFRILGVGVTDNKYTLGDNVSEVHIGIDKENGRRAAYNEWMYHNYTVTVLLKVAEYGEDTNGLAKKTIEWRVSTSTTFKDLRRKLEEHYFGEYFFELFCAKGNLYPLDMNETVSSLGDCITHDELSRWHHLNSKKTYATVYYRKTDRSIADTLADIRAAADAAAAAALPAFEESSSSESLESSDDEQGGLWKWAKSFFR